MLILKINNSAQLTPNILLKLTYHERIFNREN